MKLSYDLLTDNYDLKKENLNLFVIENKTLFQKLIFSDVIESLNFYKDLNLVSKKEIIFINNLFDLDINSKKYLDSVYKDIVKFFPLEANEEKYYNFLKSLYEFSDSIVDSQELDIVYGDEFNLLNFLKYMNFKIRSSSDTFLENLIEYIEISMKLMNISLVITVNLLSFLSHEEIKILIEQCVRFNIYLFDIESVYVDDYQKYNLILIDNDLCRIC